MRSRQNEELILPQLWLPSNLGLSDLVEVAKGFFYLGLGKRERKGADPSRFLGRALTVTGRRISLRKKKEDTEFLQ